MDKGSFSLIGLGSLSEPMTKLIESVSSAIGVLYEPTRVRRKAKADTDAAMIQAKGNIEIHEIEARAQRRINEVEIRRQRNIESIIRMAASQLPETVSKEPVDKDWMAQFFNYCQDVCNEEMQSVWARLLAREVAEPGKFTLRTLNTVKLLLPEEAQLFERCTRYLCQDQRLYYSFVKDFLADQRGFSDWVFHHLNDIGLFSVRLFGHINRETTTIVYFNKQFTVTKSNVEDESDFGTIYGYYELTMLGQELLTLCNPKPDYEYFKALYHSFKSDEDLQVSKITKAKKNI
jgi:hypothetical protein